LFPPDDDRLSLETCRGRKINTLKKVKKVRQVGCKSRNTISAFVGVQYSVNIRLTWSFQMLLFAFSEIQGR
jgi:hypothetical protein